ncbi:hypothetical protein [Chitinolyticbacter meiyuanensis]|uniref:hypothetical protein n=1 Tax=Chitinolyticbacter meiyuanensis TaxID=682798 RepID=UPI0011E5932B|nr:hypothetical protein [Chitinolyticbacter meiyuanensis]
MQNDVEVVKLLDNWAKWSWTLASGGGMPNLYMSPEERLNAGGASRPATVDEESAMRVEAVVSVMQESFRELLRKHFVFKAHPARVCRQLRLPMADYQTHVNHAVGVFGARWSELRLTPTKMIRYLSLNNSNPLRRVSTRERVASHV